MVSRLNDRAFTDALALLSTWEGHRNHAAQLRALKVATNNDDLMGLYTSAVLRRQAIRSTK